MEKFRRGPGILLAVLWIALCLALCWQAIDLYRIGNRPENFSMPGVRITPVYSRESAGERLLAVLPLGVAVLAALVAALCLESNGPERPRALRFPADTLKRLQAQAAEIPPEAEGERQTRRLLYLSAGAVLLLCAICGGSYLLNGAHFTDWDLESVMGAMLLHVAPFVAMGFLTACLAAYALDCSREREIAILKKVPRKAPAESTKAPSNQRKTLLRGALYLAAGALIVLGVLNGGLRDVLIKAINICTECIGLG